MQLHFPRLFSTTTFTGSVIQWALRRERKAIPGGQVRSSKDKVPGYFLKHTITI